MIEPPGWTDERLESAFGQLAGTGRHAPPVGDVMAAVRVVRREHRSLPSLRPAWPRPRTVAAIGVVVVLVAGGAGVFQATRLAPTGQPTTLPSGHLVASGFQLDYPREWLRYAPPATTGFGSPIAILSTVPWDASCGQDDINCYLQQKLPAGGISVVVSEVAGGDTIDDVLQALAANRRTVDGLPAYRNEDPAGADSYDLADSALTWVISSPQSPLGTITIAGRFREPGAAEARIKVDAMVESLRFDPPPVRIADGASQGPAATVALTRGLQILDSSLRGQNSIAIGPRTMYDCVPREPGTSHDSTVEYGSIGWLGGDVQVTCQAEIEAVAGLWWRMTMTITANGNTREPGQAYVETDWLAADGTPVGTTSEGYVPVALIDAGPGWEQRAARAVRTALDGYDGMADFYACFSRTPGQSRKGSISSDPDGATHYGTVAVTCTTSVRPGPDRATWALTLEARWAAEPGRKAGAIVVRIEVDATGGVVSQEILGDPLPGPISTDATPAPRQP